MKNDPKVSVIVTIYNEEAFVASTVESIRYQIERNWECVVVDNGSTDASLAALHSAVGSDLRFKVLSKPNAGLSAARNFGSRHAHPAARYIAFVDGDDSLAPGFVGTLSGYLDLHGAVGLVTCAFVVMGKDGKLLNRGKRSRYRPGLGGFPHSMGSAEHVTPFVSFFCATGQGPFAMYRRSVYEKTDGYDETLWPHEDTDMFCQMALLAEVHHLEAGLYWKRTHPRSTTQMGLVASQTAFKGFKVDAYSIFRRKWDTRSPRDDKEAQLLDDSRHYYYWRHKPLRDFKIALKSLRDFCRHGNKGTLEWAWKLLISGVKGLFTGYGCPGSIGRTRQDSLPSHGKE